MNKYLIKSAALQETLRGILNERQVRHDEIEEPIEAMYEGFDDLEEMYSARNHGMVQVADMFDVPSMHKIYVEKNMRKILDTDGSHAKNSIDTARKLLREASANPDAELSPNLADRIVRSLSRIHPESNGTRGLKSLGTTGTAIVGGLGGAIAGGYLNPAASIPGAVLGTLAGGFAGHYGLGALMDNKIKARDDEIYDTQEANIAQVYNRLRNQYPNVSQS